MTQNAAFFSNLRGVSSPALAERIMLRVGLTLSRMNKLGIFPDFSGLLVGCQGNPRQSNAVKTLAFSFLDFNFQVLNN